MNTEMQGHNHGGKNHLLRMVGIAGLVLLALLAAGRSLREALPLAALLACPLMMIGMMFMMRGGDHHEHAGTSKTGNGQHDDDETADQRSGMAVAPRQALPTLPTPRSSSQRSRRP